MFIRAALLTTKWYINTLIGYKFLKDDEVIWRDNQGGLLPLSPPTMLRSLNEKDARRLMKKTGAHFLRWESSFDRMSSGHWWHVVKSDFEELRALSSNTRSKVRRGLKHFRCLPVSRGRVIEEGFAVYRDAFSRYETHEPAFSEKVFQQAIRDLPSNTEFWGAEDDIGELVAFSENYIDSQTCFFNTVWFKPSALRQYVSYALFHEMHQHYLMERRFDYVSDGARSISHDSAIHDFLMSKFGYRKAYADLHVVYKPWLFMAIQLAFPLRMLLAKINLSAFRKASILLKQEEVRRQCMKGK